MTRRPKGTVSLLDISNSDNKETRKAAARKKARKSDVKFTAWRDEQICQGNEAIAWHNKQVHDYMDTGRTSKAPDIIGPPLTYMEERGVFKPLDTIANPLGLCRSEKVQCHYRTKVHSQCLQDTSLVGIGQRIEMTAHCCGL